MQRREGEVGGVAGHAERAPLPSTSLDPAAPPHPQTSFRHSDHASSQKPQNLRNMAQEMYNHAKNRKETRRVEAASKMCSIKSSLQKQDAWNRMVNAMNDLIRKEEKV